MLQSSDSSKISFSFSTFTFKIDEWKKNRSYYELMQIIEIENCPTTLEASKLISNSIFRSSLESLKSFIVLILKINEELNENQAEKPKINEFNEINRNFIISFESNKAENEKIIFWRNGNEGKFLTIKLMKDYSAEVTNFVRNYLIDNVDMNLDNSFFNNFELANINDSNNLNFLMKAVESTQTSTLIEELLYLPFDINQKSNDGKTAADIAYEAKNFQILLLLLEENSTFPNKFSTDDLELDETSEKIKNILNISRNLHDAIEANNSLEIQRIIDDNLNLRYFYNSSNVSAATIAIKADKIEIYGILLAHECSIGPEEDFNKIINEAYNKSDTNEPKIKRMKSELLTTHDYSSIELPEKHLIILCANSVISHDNQAARLRLKCIKEIFNFLNEIPIARQILQLTSLHNNFKINFDFNRSSVEFMNPYNGDQSTRGLCEYVRLKKFFVYIAAKMLLDENEKYSMIATLAHELCHFAINLTFCNDAKPYAIDDEENRLKFDGIIAKCSGLKDIEQIVSLVFNYDQNEWPSELIVRVPHMIVNYHNNSNRLDALKVIFKELFDYYNDVVVPKMNQSLKRLEKLFNNSFEIEFNDLTAAYKAKIHHSNVNFQGVELKFNKIAEDENSEIYQHLTSEQIRKISIDDENLKIGCAQKIKKEIYTEREFIDFELKIMSKWNKELNKSVWRENVLNNLKKFDQILSAADDTKMILLSDFAGAGKTTTFKHLTMKLKQKFPNYWVFYIDLKRYLKVYEKFEQNFNISQVLFEILSITDKFEVEIFTKLFYSNKVILLYDGVDEISPKFKDFFIKFIEIVRISTKNQQWIATRPQHMQELKEKFNQNAYKLMLFDDDKKIDLIENVLKNLNEKNVEAKKVLHAIRFSFNSMSHDYNSTYSPMMLQIMTEIYANDATILTNSNLFSLYDKMIEIKKKVLGKKGEIANEDRESHRTKLTICQVHQIYALELVYKSGFKDYLNNSTIKINEFQLLKRWKKEKSKWTSEQISRYGFLIIDNWNTNDEFPDFVHRTFAEFFIAQFLIHDLYELDEDDDEMSEKEIELRVKLLIEVTRNNLQITKLILSFIDAHKSKKMHNHCLKLTTSEDVKFFLKNILKVDKQLNLIRISSLDERFLKEFKFHDDKSIFQYFMIECDSNYVMKIIDVYKESLGVDWYHYNGFSLKENFSLTNNPKIDDFSYFLCFIDQIEIPQNEFFKFFINNFYKIYLQSFKSSFATQKLFAIIQSNFINCKSEFLKFANKKTEYNWPFSYETEEFHKNFHEFLASDETVCVDDIRYSMLNMIVNVNNMDILMKLYSENKFSKSEIQHYVIKNSVRFIDYICANKSMTYILENFFHFFEEIFNAQSEKWHLRKFLETRCEDNMKHTVFSFLEANN